MMNISPFYLMNIPVTVGNYKPQLTFYSGRKLFGRIAQDDKDELKGLLTGFAFVLVFILFVMLLVYMNNSSN